MEWEKRVVILRTKEYEDFIYTDNSNPMGGLKVGNQEILYKVGVEGYIILARLVGKQGKRSENDFSDSEHGTVHVMYGVNAKATLAAVKA